ncbi:MAG: alpha/beta fold hydrolase [Cyclobacteriaceae bacterium]|nr:alpha/beta fold hydrolase [Cyclobacteriaceae bacterium]
MINHLSFLHKSILFLLTILLWNCSSSIEEVNTEGFLEINGSPVFYKAIGSGPPIIVIHGGPLLNHSYMISHFEQLAKDYTLIFYDQRLCGQSSIEVDLKTFRLDGFVQDIELLRKALDLEHISILGHSWGGFLAMKYAIAFPDNLDALILSNSMPGNYKHWRQEEEVIAKRNSPEDSLKRQEIISTPFTMGAKAITSLILLSYKNLFYNPLLVDSLQLNLTDDYMDRSKIFNRLGPEINNYDLYSDLKNVNTPTLVIYGDTEPAASISAPLLVATIPNSELVVLKDCGHFPFIEQPQNYFQKIKEFLSFQVPIK